MTAGRVLIVEDNVALEGRRLQKWLVSRRFEVIAIAKSIADAEKYVDRKPDVVVIDVMIPPDKGLPDDDEGGLKVARRFQRECGSCVVFVTGRDASPDFLANVHRASSNSFFLLKPLNAELTVATVELAVLRRRSSKLVFVCYAHEDRAIKDELASNLGLLSGIGIDAWDDARLNLGDRWRVEVMNALSRADVAIVLVSVAMMRSRFIQELELPQLLAGEEVRRLRVIPVFVGAVPTVALEGCGITKFQGMNSPDDPIGLWSARVRQAKVWTPLCDRLVRGV